MTAGVRTSGDAAEALESVRSYLAAKPVEHNLMLSLLTQRVAHPEDGRYWWATEGGSVVGFAFQSPRHFRALLSPTDPRVVDALGQAMADEAPDLPGVMGDAATAAVFAGQWAERRRVAVTPTEAQRLYRLGTVRPPEGIGGRLRLAGADDRERLVPWAAGFAEATGGHPFAPATIIDSHLAAGRLWLWDDGGAVSMAAISAEVAGVVRVAFVYTPPEHRRRGYAAACVAALSARVVAEGRQCVLYAQLHNPTSNAVYRRIGYEPVLELLIYRFG